MITEESLQNIQEELNKAYTEYAKKDFHLKYNHYQLIESKLHRRDNIICEMQAQNKLLDYYEQAFLKYDMSTEFLPVDPDGNPDAKWIKSVVARYEKDYNIYVEIKLNENRYLNNNVMFKKVNLETDECKNSPLEWKSSVKAPIFDYFQNSSEDTIMFDILYEIYVDSVFYYFLEESHTKTTE